MASTAVAPGIAAIASPADCAMRSVVGSSSTASSCPTLTIDLDAMWADLDAALAETD